VEAQEVRWDKGDAERAENYTFLLWKKEYVSKVKEMILCVSGSYQKLRE
jgi:hypothetical protein